MVAAPKQVSVILFYDHSGDILLQDRKEISKWGEEYGFFGGKVEEGESAENALERELFEELGLSQVDYKTFMKYSHTNKELSVTVLRNVYLSTPIPDLEHLTCNEGKPIIKHFNDRFVLKMIPGFNELLDDIYHKLIKEREIRA